LNSNSSHVRSEHSTACAALLGGSSRRLLSRAITAHPPSPPSSASGIRIEFPTRTCPSFPLLHSPYTVAVQTRSRSAASFTVSSRSTLASAARRASEVCSTGAANGELTGAIPCNAWTRPFVPTRALPTHARDRVTAPRRFLVRDAPTLSFPNPDASIVAQERLAHGCVLFDQCASFWRDLAEAHTKPGREVVVLRTLATLTQPGGAYSGAVGQWFECTGVRYEEARGGFGRSQR
jgi:hypothetical protein